MNAHPRCIASLSTGRIADKVETPVSVAAHFDFKTPAIQGDLTGDADVTPEFRVSANANHLWFADTRILQELRNEGSINRRIGWDISAAAIWRPNFTQNLVFRASAAMLQPGKGFRDLFASSDRDKRYVSVLLNAIVTY